jgi:hypothetical protein
MPQLASHMYTPADTMNSQLDNAIITSVASFGSSETAFGGPIRDQIFGPFSASSSSTERQHSGVLAVDATRFSPPRLAPVRWYSQGARSSSVVIILASVGSPAEGNPSFRRDLLTARQDDQTPEGSNQQGRIKRVQVIGAETGAFAGFGDSQLGEIGTARERSGGLVRALRDLEDFSHDDWDADGARGITPEVLGEAARVLNFFPNGIPEPEVAPASDGSVCMEWDSSAGSLWLDIEPDRTARTLLKIGSLKEERQFRADAPDLATYLRAAAARLYSSKPNMAIRSVMVPA